MVTTVKYSHWNHFYDGSDTDSYSSSYISTKDASDADWVEGLGDATGGHENDLWIEADPISTMQLKVECSMKWVMPFRSQLHTYFGKTADESDLWFNFGLIDKAPIFDQVIQDWDAKMSTDPKNENHSFRVWY